MSTIFLKIKIKSLLEEVAIIRREEDKRPHRLRDAKLHQAADGWENAVDDFWLRQEMKFHRKTDIRLESRATYVAYAFLRGRTYESVEPKARWKKQPYTGDLAPNWDRVAAMVSKYGAGKTILIGNHSYEVQYNSKGMKETLLQWANEEVPVAVAPPKGAFQKIKEGLNEVLDYVRS